MRERYKHTSVSDERESQAVAVALAHKLRQLVGTALLGAPVQKHVHTHNLLLLGGGVSERGLPRRHRLTTLNDERQVAFKW